MKKLFAFIFLLPIAVFLFLVTETDVYAYLGQCCNQTSECDQSSGSETCSGALNTLCFMQSAKNLTCVMSGTPTGCSPDGTTCNPFASPDPCCHSCQITAGGSYRCGEVAPPPDPEANEPFRPTECTGPDDVYGPSLMTGLGCISTYPVSFITDIQGILITIGGGIAFLLLIIGAFFILTSRGDKEHLARGKEIFVGAVVGLLLLILTMFLLNFITGSLLNLFA